MGLCILSCGAGMQSTALALMACENKMIGYSIYPKVPIYDAIIFCDLGLEPPWVYEQVAFIKAACEQAGISFKVLETHLYQEFIETFGKKKYVRIPFWTLSDEGKKGKLRRACTVTYKILEIQKFVRYELLGYQKGQHLKKEDIGAHEMHIGFSQEEQDRIFDSYNRMFVNRFPLVEMGLERKDNYTYIRDVWGLETKASSCCFCPYHKNYYYWYIKNNHWETYVKLLDFDARLEKYQPFTAIRDKLYLTNRRMRLWDMLPDDLPENEVPAVCDDAEYFPYEDNNGQFEMIWKGF